MAADRGRYTYDDFEAEEILAPPADTPVLTSSELVARAEQLADKLETIRSALLASDLPNEVVEDYRATLDTVIYAFPAAETRLAASESRVRELEATAITPKEAQFVLDWGTATIAHKLRTIAARSSSGGKGAG